MEYSILQENIFSQVDSSENLIINAVAGSGKSTTLLEISNRVHPKASLVYTAFNKSIAENLQQKLKERGNFKARATNIHKIGFSLCGSYWGQNLKGKVDNYKYKKILEEYLLPYKYSINKSEKIDYQQLFYKILKLQNLAYLSLIEPDKEEELLELADYHGIDLFGYSRHYLESYQHYWDKGLQAFKRGSLDFNDMIVIPYRLKLRGVPSDYILIDECQDLNNAQLYICLSLKGEFTTIIGCGDPHQAIYGFTGSDVHSFNNLKNSLQAKELPLSICYRCGCSIVYEAQSIVEQIEYGLNNPIGKVDSISTSKLIEVIEEKDCAILSRKNSNLISLYFKLIRKGKSSKILGRNIGDGIISLMEELGLEYLQYDTIENVLEHHVEEKSKRLKTEESKQNLRERIDCVIAVWQECSSYVEMLNKLEILFSDTQLDNFITLTSIHKSKGLEWDTVYLLRESLPLQYPGQQDWQYEQELNLKYVGITRAKINLFWVE